VDEWKYMRMEIEQADALACNKEPVQFTDSTGRKALIPCDGVKIVGTVEPNDALAAPERKEEKA
jgi:hypothetical protein